MKERSNPSSVYSDQIAGAKMNYRLRPLLLALVLGALSGLPVFARTITFEERVRAQEAIERVYYSHQVGAAIPFEQAVPRSLLERKVLTYLRQSVALDRFWQHPISAEMLQAELRRIARGTRMPDRLEELYRALGNDSFLIQETLVRQTLAGRLVENLSAFDARIHATERVLAEKLHRELSRGGRRVTFDGLPLEIELARVANGSRSPASEPDAAPDSSSGPRRVEISGEELRRWRSRLAQEVGEVGPVLEELEAFFVRIVLESTEDRLRFLQYEVPKKSPSAWWRESAQSFSPNLATPVADVHAALLEGGPAPATICACGSADFWDNGTLDDMPEPRYYHGSVWTGSLMIVWGGTISVYKTNTGGRYDPATDTWTPMSTTGAPQARNQPFTFWTGSRVLVWGGDILVPTGFPSPPQETNTGGLYDPVSDSWSPTSLSGAPAPLSRASAVWTGSEMIVWGGFDDFIGFSDAGYRYNPAADTWSPTSTAGAPSPREGHAAVWTGSEMIIWGGLISSSHLDTGGKYNPATDSWTPTSLAGAPIGRWLAVAAWTGSRMIIWSGFAANNTMLSDGALYDPVADSWSAMSTAPSPLPIQYATTVWTGTEMVVWGGNFNSVPSNAGARYHPGTNSWTPTSTAGVVPRYWHSAVWTGSEMIVWGGIDPGGKVQTGGRYNPTTDSWTPTSLGQAPSPRLFHSGVWTGSLMLIWGGQGSIPGASGFVSLDSGGRYDPALDTWLSMTTVGAPTPRSGHTDVWTGNRMIVWGGVDAGGRVNSGGRYDAVADSWLPTSLTGAPTPRGSHGAVWSGTRMIVWGGFDGTNYLGSGGLYDPVSDAWLPMTSINPPPAVRAPEAVWTGDRLLVWGGFNASGAVNTGGRYDPVYDVWRPISLGGAPIPRRNFTAVWNGARMIVWGGTNSSVSQYYDSGGIYDPLSDQWLPTSLSGSPEGRWGHTAVWTGTRMLVFGGYNPITAESPQLESAEPYLITGGNYDPVSENWASLADEIGRVNHTAVWTGSRMIVWGGQIGGVSNDGASYCGIFPPHYYRDNDTDGVGNSAVTIVDCSQPSGYVLTPGDCSDSNGSLWSRPSEATNVRFSSSSLLEWNPPSQPGAASVVYDAIRSGNPADFVIGASCLATDSALLSLSDATAPSVGSTLNYLVRAQNSCPAVGSGSLGFTSLGDPRIALDCP